MQIIALPLDPTGLSTKPKSEQASFSALLYSSMAKYAGECRVTRDELIRWINEH